MYYEDRNSRHKWMRKYAIHYEGRQRHVCANRTWEKGDRETAKWSLLFPKFEKQYRACRLSKRQCRVCHVCSDPCDTV